MSNDIVSAARALVATPSADAYVVLELAVLRHELAEARREAITAQYAALDEHERADLAELAVCTQAEALETARSQLSLYEQLLREKDTRIDELEHEVSGLDLLHESAVAMRDRLQAERDALEAECRKRGEAVAELEAEVERVKAERVVPDPRGTYATGYGDGLTEGYRKAEREREIRERKAATQTLDPCPVCGKADFANAAGRGGHVWKCQQKQQQPPADLPFTCPQCKGDAFARAVASDVCIRCAQQAAA
jgi:DNA repair exonuclease SbcCD ATPase subunit